MHGPDEGGPGLVVEHDDDGGGGQVSGRVPEPPALLRPDVGEVPVDGDGVGGDQVELVQVPQPLTRTSLQMLVYNIQYTQRIHVHM